MQPSSAPRTPALSLRRPLGDNELSYFLPSRAAGVNDMYLHHRFAAPAQLVTPERVLLAWAGLRGRHPLLAARAEGGWDAGWEFAYDAPASLDEALALAGLSLDFRQTPSASEDVVRAYLNGPRTLAPDKLSALIVSRSAAAAGGHDTGSDAAAAAERNVQWDIVLCTTHFVGDGLALHTALNELYMLAFGAGAAADGAEVGAGKGAKEVDELRETVRRELDARIETGRVPFPEATETQLSRGLSPSPAAAATAAGEDGPARVQAFDARAAWRRAFGRVLYELDVGSGVGGQSLAKLPPSSSAPAAPRTTVNTFALSTRDTAALLRACKRDGVNVGQAVVGALGVGWAGVRGRALVKEEPSLFYSAMSLRHLLPSPPPADKGEKPSYFHLCLGYYTLSLPAFLLPPSQLSSAPAFASPACAAADHDDAASDAAAAAAARRTLLHRAALVKHQTARATAPAVGGGREGARAALALRALAEGRERRARSEGWGRADDGLPAASAQGEPTSPTAEGVQKSAAGEKALVGLGLGVVMPSSTVTAAPSPAPERALEQEKHPARSQQVAAVGKPGVEYTPPLTAPSTPATAPGLASAAAVVAGAAAAVPPSPAPANVPHLGLSLLGNLDALYTPSLYPAVALQQLTTGSRQRRGAALVFVYSFAGRLWVSAGWEMEGLGGGEGEMGRWWEGTKRALGEALLGRKAEGETFVV